MNSLSPNNKNEIDQYIDSKTAYDMAKLMQKYGFTSWQAEIIRSEVGCHNYLHTMNTYTYNKDKISQDEYNEAKLNYDKFIAKLDEGDWKYFATSQLKDVEEQIQTAKEAESINLNSLYTQKQILEWRIDKDIAYGFDFLNDCLEGYSNASSFIESYNQQKNPSYTEKIAYYKALSSLNINKYYIENNINNISSLDNREILLNLFENYELFILIFIIMIAGGIVSDEFSKGTIKMLLVRPYHRCKILLSKFIVCITMLLFIVVFIAVAQLVVGGIIFGFDSLGVPAVIYNYDTSQVQTMSIPMYLIITGLAKLPMYILLMTLAFACSTIFINTAISIVIPLLGYMGSQIINSIASTYNLIFLNYFVTPNWDLTSYLFGGLPDFEGLTIAFSISICIIYFAIMFVASFASFKHTDIKNI